MRNPLLDKLTLADRLIAFTIWGIAGFLGGLLALPPATNTGSLVALLIGGACGVIGAIWPRAISSIMRSLWHN